MKGINRKIRGFLESAFCFGDQDFLKLRLYALHEAKLKFVGSTISVRGLGSDICGRGIRTVNRRSA